MAILCPVPKAVYAERGESLISRRHADYFKPLHVDCSVEYELPSCAKSPGHHGAESSRREPLLMIHPLYYRREEGRHRDPFVINLPAAKLRSVENWKPTPPRRAVARSRSGATAATAAAQYQRKRPLDAVASCVGTDCGCGGALPRAVAQPTSSSSRRSTTEKCFCGEVHRHPVVTTEPTGGGGAAVWSSCGAAVKDLRTDRRLAEASATVDCMHVKPSDRNNNDCANGGDINDKFRKLRRLQTYVEQAKGCGASRRPSAVTAAPSSSLAASVGHHHGLRSGHDIHASRPAAEAPPEMRTKRAKKAEEAFGCGATSASSFEYCAGEPYARHCAALGLYEPQPAAAAPAVVPMALHWNCDGYYRAAAGANAISTMVRGSENMWRLFQV